MKSQPKSKTINLVVRYISRVSTGRWRKMEVRYNPMADFMIKLPGNFHYVYQFEPGKSTFRCVEATLCMAAQMAYPDRYKNLSQLMSQIYVKYVGADVPGDRNGTTR